MEFSKYVGFGSSEDPSFCLYLECVSHGKDSVGTYCRPKETGWWNCETAIVDGEIVITQCKGKHLIGKILHPVSREQFLKSNSGVSPEKYA